MLAFLRMFAALSVLTLISACGGGGGADVQTENTTVGQELLDLQKARDSGAITQDEYEDQRDKALDRR